MKKFLRLILGATYMVSLQAVCYASDAFDVLPDLPDVLSNAAQASSVNTNVATNPATAAVAQSVGHEPNFLSMIFSLFFVILLIYATGILYTKLNKFGAKTMKNQRGSFSDSQVSVISTTPLGANKTLHVVELDGKRMLIGASSTSIHLIKDLGKYPPTEEDSDLEFSKIEIPNIRIPKIEIPKIEFPGFTRVLSKVMKDECADSDRKESYEDVNDNKSQEQNDDFQISDIYEENSDGIIDELFQTNTVKQTESTVLEDEYHKVDPDDFALYKKYL